MTRYIALGNGILQLENQMASAINLEDYPTFNEWILHFCLFLKFCLDLGWIWVECFWILLTLSLDFLLIFATYDHCIYEMMSERVQRY